MAKLAILGHPTRSEEVIQILEMLGGINAIEHCGNNANVAYYIKETYKNWIDTCYPINLDGFIILTLEEFLEKFPYKVGDKVCFSDNPHHYLTIMEIWWNDDCSDLECTFYEDNIDVSVSDLYPYKEETMEDNIKEKCDLINFNSHHIFAFADRVELILEDDWEVKNEKGKTFVVRKPPLYPKSFENCLKILGYNIAHTIPMNHGHNGLLMMKFQRLIIYRDAYWKIVGEQIGLGKPWKPDWDDEIETYYTISYDGVNIKCYNNTDVYSKLAFPTEEMRDAFYENFKELINETKELL